MLTKLQLTFEGLALREKLIAVLAGSVMLWGLWNSLYYQPLQQKRVQLQQTLDTLAPQLENIQLQTVGLVRNPKHDPNQSNQSQLAELKAAVQGREEQMLMGYKKFVPPKLMAKALSDMFNQHAQIKLIKLDILPVTTLLTTNQVHPIYKHGLAVTFTGGFLETLNYLKVLEALPWHFNWDSIEYQVKIHPQAETTLRIYTLSFEKDWLSV